MVQAIHPAWGNRSCLRFGIYSEALDNVETNSTKSKNKRLRYGVVAGMILGATLLVSQMSVFMYDLMSLIGFRYILLSCFSLVCCYQILGRLYCLHLQPWKMYNCRNGSKQISKFGEKKVAKNFLEIDTKK